MEPDLIPNYQIQQQIFEDQDQSYGPNLIRMKITDQVKELQTVLRDK